MGSKTINTEIRRLIEEGKKLSTSVKDIDISITEGATALKMDRKVALELAEKIITFANIIEDGNRINLTVLKDTNRISLTSY